MPIDLPVRQAAKPDIGLKRTLDIWASIFAALCFAVALAEVVSLTPKTYRDGLSNAVYEAMLQGP